MMAGHPWVEQEHGDWGPRVTSPLSQTPYSLPSISSIQFSRSVLSDSLPPHGLQHARLPVLHQLLKLAQTHVHRVGDAIQPS